MSKQFKGYAQLAMAMALVGSSFVVARVVVESFPVFLASGLRYGIAALVLVPVLARQERGLPAMGRQDVLALFCQALTGAFLFSVLLLYGVRYTTASESGIVASTTPAVIGLLSFLALKERVSPRMAAGIVFAVGGVAAITVLGDVSVTERGANPMLGNLLVFGAVVGEAVFVIIGKVASTRLSPLAISTFAIGFAFLLFLPLALVEARRFDFGAVSTVGWLAVLYYALVVTVLGYLLHFEGLAKVPASAAGIFTGVVPMSALVLSYLVLGETLLWIHLVGVVCVLIAIGLSVSRPRRSREAAVSPMDVGKHPAV